MGSYVLKNCDIANIETLRFERKDIVIKDDTIETISDNVSTYDADATVIDAAGKMVLPGFIDCHTHLYQSFYKGLMDDYTITDWLVRLFSIEDIMTEDEFYYSVLVGCMSSLRFGTTTINDMTGYRYIDATIQAIRDSGIRATVGINLADIAENEKTRVMTVNDCIEQAEDVYKRFHELDDGQIRISVAPPGLPACSKELMQSLKTFAKERGLLFHTHLAEGKKETMDVYNRTGYWEAEALYHYGILDSNTLLAHSIWLEDFELDLIKKANSNPVHCPNTNMKISDGIPKIHQMIQKGINVCMGCDGEASSSTRDMVREARAGAYLQKAVTLNPKAMDLSTTYKMLTVNGAKALGYTNLGRIKEGFKADLIIINMSTDISLINNAMRLSNLMYAGTGHAVDTVFANGKLILSDGRNVRVNTEKVIEKSEELFYEFNNKVNKM